MSLSTAKRAKTDGSAVDIESLLCWALEHAFFGGDDAASILHASRRRRRSGGLFSYLDTFDLIRLMHVSKATRRFAAPVLNKLENDIAQTRGHTDYFRGILRRTGIAKNKAVWSNLEENGSLRKGAIIQHNAREI